MATIIGCPRKIVICGKTVKIMEVNFLAVHKKLREKRLAQKMIEEMMRRKRLHGFPQAYYTSGHTMPTPFATSLYLNRFINCKKLVEIKYTNKPHDMPMKNFEKRYRLPDKQGTGLVGVIRPMLKKDLTAVLKLYHAQMAKTQIYYKMSQEEIAHFLLPKDDVVWTYVVEGEVDGKSAVTDFFSMYRLSQTCTSKAELGHNYDDMHSGCMFYYGLSANSLKSLMKEALWKAKEELSCDAFTVMTIMENKREMFLEDLGFLPGDGALHWYFVNWSLGDKKIESHDIGTILI
uniref:Glycylpeptide N-tetradecanoyltransferase n=1 Tax=Strombidium inclinatum TaxID=197538 RepID=A0A7S3MZS9_9SPIT|mmetsp:Transcript_32914/g.50321  ORF Transcript_32914/g.50321 Transcript_32914/m.50321 type:complete len:290 (+) Transcript_32914:623-1492(+)